MEMNEYETREGRGKVVFVKVSRDEALGLMQSLSGQLLMNNPNHNRMETFLADGRDFTIAVQQE